MAWLVKFITSSIGQKIVMSLSGLFLCLFLVIHVVGNTQLFINDGGEAFNLYTYQMTSSPLIKIVGYFTYATILLHAVQGILLYFQNRMAKGVGYSVKTKDNASFAARNMAFLGTVIFVYIVVHMGNFWYVYKWGSTEMMTIDGEEYKNMYVVVQAAFKQLWLVILYVVSMVMLGLHLSHGFQSGFQTLGINHLKYTPLIKNLSIGLFGILIPTLFAAMPLYFYFVR